MSKPKFVACEKCDDGFIYDEDEKATKKCSCRLQYQRETKLRIMLEKANIPFQISSNKDAVTLLNYDIDKDYVGDDKQGNLIKIKKFIDKFDEKYSSLNLYFYGLHSTQKSTVSRYIGRELLKKGKTVHYVLLDTLVKDLLDAERDEDLKAECKRLLNVDFLIIDEASTDKTTLFKSGYQIPFLTSFLKRRMESIRKSTLFCSNSPIDSLHKGFGEAIQRLVFREVLDHSMVFEDSYEAKLTAFDADSLWE